MPSIAAASVLAYQGALLSMLQGLWWTAGHYSAVNRVPYGSLLVDPGSYFEGAQGLGLAVRLARLGEALLPSILPVAAFVGLAVLFWRRRASLEQSRALLTLLGLFSAGLIMASLPRLAAHQLFFVMPAFCVLCSYVMYVLLKESWRWSLTTAFLLVACVFVASGMRQDGRFTELVATPAGELKCIPEDAALLSALMGRIHPKESLFVFPYLPVIYFVTGGQNPTRYSFLQPGLMTNEAESGALAGLQSNPPRRIVWWQAPTSVWITNWPNIDPTRLHFPLIESFIQSRYSEALQMGQFVVECQAGTCE